MIVSERIAKFEKVKNVIKASEVYTIHTDGASKGNPGPASVGYIISDAGGKEIYTNAMTIGEGTNNMAEYVGVIFGLKSAIGLGIKRIHVYSDSELVVKQVNGKYKVSNEEMKVCHEEVKQLCRELSEHEIHWIPRHENKKANDLAQDALYGYKPKNDPAMEQEVTILNQVSKASELRKQENKEECR